MKWGQRNTSRSSGGSGTKAKVIKTTKRPMADDAHAMRKLMKKKPSELTNEELKMVTNRHKLETSYRKANPTPIGRGKLAVGALIAAGATGVTVYNMIHGPAGQAAIKQGEKRTRKLRNKIGGKLITSLPPPTGLPAPIASTLIKAAL
jgi:hypothetical protein